MIRNQTGGVISKVFIIPAGVVVIISVFLAGYFLGKRQGARTASAEKPPALPEVISQYVPDRAEFTFYNTLTDKGDKTISIDLKPKEKSETAPASRDAVKQGEKKPADRSGQTTQPEAKQSPPQQAKKKESVAPRTETPKVRYSIQVGSYEDKAMAEDEVRNMKQRGYAAFVVAGDIPEKGRWYRVRIGSFSNKQAAEKLANELKSKEGITSFITTE
jgi:cell division septation protein DedD